MPSYRPFLVRIAQPVDGAYPVTAEFQGLEARSSIPGDVLRQCLADATAAGRTRSAQLGSRLFSAVFTGDVLRLYNTAQDWLAPDERLRIVLAQPLPGPLAQLPWELVFDAPVEPRSLAATHNSPLVRHAPADELPHAPPQGGTLRVLAVTAFPAGVLAADASAAALARNPRPGELLRRLASDVRDAALRDTARWLLKGRRYQVTTLDSPTLDALDQHVRAAEATGEGYHVVHLFGQATEEGEFLLPGREGGWEPVRPARLVELCTGEALAVFAVTLCQPEPAGDAIRCAAEEATRRGVPAVVGMQAPQLDRPVVEFAREFYRALAAGEPIELALAYGRRLVAQLHGRHAVLPLPALYMSHTGGLALPALERVHVLPRAWRVASWGVATALAVAGATSSLLDLPNFPAMLRERAPVIRCVYPNGMDPNKLTIAFQPFTVVDENGRVIRSAAGREVAEFLYERFNPALKELKLDIPYEMRAPTLSCALQGANAEDRAAAAAALADRIDADIMVYGVITDTVQSDRLALAFHVSYGAAADEAELAGPYALGGPLPVTLPFDPETLLAIEHPPHLVRMNVLAELVVGMSYLKADNPEKSLTYIRQAQQDKHWPNADGKEFAYLLLGHALIRQASLSDSAAAAEEGLAAYETALAIHPGYFRAQLGRAGALVMLALTHRDADNRPALDRERLAESEAAYRALLAPSASPLTGRERAAAQSGLGYVYLTSAVYGVPQDADRARVEFNDVIAQYEAGDATLEKTAGACYGYLGALAMLEQNVPAAVASYGRAADLVGPALRALYLYRLGELACKQGDHAEAVRRQSAAIDEARLYGLAADVDKYTALLKQMQNRSCP